MPALPFLLHHSPAFHDHDDDNDDDDDGISQGVKNTTLVITCFSCYLLPVTFSYSPHTNVISVVVRIRDEFLQ
jgi:hypothetical protein